jgi:uncharacterized protein (DUF952 family)
MPVYKILRGREMAELAVEGIFAGSADDRRDGFVHLSAAEQVAGTAARHFAGETGLWIVAFDPIAMDTALRWEVSRGGARFPHLYRALILTDVIWARPLPLGPEGHMLPDLDG